MKKLSNLLLKLAITWEEYSKAHPRTKKNPNDPLFTKGQPSAPKQQQAPAPSAPQKQTAPEKKPEAEPKKPSPKKPAPKKKPSDSTPTTLDGQKIGVPKKKLDEMTDDELVEKYRPPLVKSANQREYSKKEVEKLTGVPYGGEWNTRVEMPEGLKTWTADDFAWQIMNGKNYDEFEGYAHDLLAGANINFLLLQNPNVPRKTKDDIAAYLIDKGGVSFVAGRSMPQYLAALARKGVLSKNILKAAQEDKIRDDLYYNGITDPDELRKFDVKKWDYQLLHNRACPGDMLLKMLDDPKAKMGLQMMERENIFSQGSASGEYESKRMSAVNHTRDIISHGNFPLDRLLKIKNMSPTNPKTRRILLERPDLPEEWRKKCLDSLLKKPLDGEYSGIQLPAFKMSPDEFGKVWAAYKADHAREMKKEGKSSEYATHTEYALDNIAQHESCPDSVLKEILAWPLRKGVAKDGEAVIPAIAKAKGIAYKKAIAKGLISDQDIATAVAKNMNLHGDMDLIKYIGEHAFTAFPVKKSTPRNFKKISDDEKKKLQEYMNKTSFHDDFDFEIVNAWEVDKEPHKDFPKVEQKINHVIKGVYHGTTFANAGGILTDGVQVGAAERTGAMFGQGFYIASASSKAAQYASDNFSHEEGEGIVFVLDVALGNTQEMKFGRPSYDEMKYRSFTEQEKKAMEDYKKRTGKPLTTKWHLNHDSVTAKAGMSLDYDEYVVKDGSQIQVKRIVHIRKKPKGAAK